MVVGSRSRACRPQDRTNLSFLPDNTHFLRGSITVRLTSCLSGLDLTKQVIFLIKHQQIS